jgi:hypothetical protein
MAEHAVDILDKCSAVVSFLRDMTCTTNFKDELCGRSVEGMTYILDWVNDDIAKAIKVIEIQESVGKISC